METKAQATKLNPPVECYVGDKGPLVIKAGEKRSVSPAEYEAIFGRRGSQVKKVRNGRMATPSRNAALHVPCSGGCGKTRSDVAKWVCGACNLRIFQRGPQ